MYTNQETEHRHIVVNEPGERRETITETTQEGPREIGISPGLIAIVALLALVAICLTFYVVNNKNANEAANRQAMLEAGQANKEQPAAPYPQQPVIIQQPAPAQQAPVIVQQPVPSVPQEKSNALDDITIQDAATKRLTDDPGLAQVSAIVISGKAILTGTVGSAELKANAEKVVKAVRGVKSVDNQITISNQ